MACRRTCRRAVLDTLKTVDDLARTRWSSSATVAFGFSKGLSVIIGAEIVTTIHASSQCATGGGLCTYEVLVNLPRTYSVYRL